MSEAAFTAALRAPDRPEPAAICAPGGGPAGVRFDVYRNNVIASLSEALAAGFPVVEQLLGPKFFAAMAREFVRDHPPDTPLMTFYGAAFPGWLRDFPPVAAWPYLPEVARLEQAIREATHASDAPPLASDDIADLSPEALSALHLWPHPSVRVLQTRFPALSIWARHRGDAANLDAPEGEVLICRPVWTVQLHAAPAGTAATLSALAGGAALGAAFPEAADPAAILACLFSAGALTPTEPIDA